MSESRVVCVDFDGVIVGGGNAGLGKPRAGARDFLRILYNNDFKVVIFSVRPPKELIKYFKDNNMMGYVSDITDEKPSALCYVDDRAIQFNGDYNDALQEISGFKTWWEKEED